ncbi:MAG: hypothetical protein ACREUO_05980, partial [Burkholderiales bacterium]
VARRRERQPPECGDEARGLREPGRGARILCPGLGYDECRSNLIRQTSREESTRAEGHQGLPMTQRE